MIRILCLGTILSFSQIACAVPLTSTVPVSRQNISAFASSTRKSFEEYAADHQMSVEALKKQFGATGQLRCPGKTRSTAQLTGAANIITTSSHAFYDNDCNPIPVQDCLFTPLFSKKSYKIKSKGAVVGECLRGQMNSEDDGAAVYLERIVPDVHPYLLPKSPVFSFANDPVTIVVAHAQNYTGGGPYIANCVVRDAYLFDKVPRMTDCSTGPGASGSAELKPVKDANGPAWEIQAVLAFDTNSTDGGLYDRSNYTASTPFSGDFFAAVTTMVNASKTYIQNRR